MSLKTSNPALRMSVTGSLMANQWDEHLRCPQCRRTGLASLHQSEGDRMPTVEFVTAGFDKMQTEFGPEFHSRVCNVSVV